MIGSGKSGGQARTKKPDSHQDGENGGNLHVIVVVPVLKSFETTANDAAARPGVGRSPEARLAEAEGLAEAIDLDIVHSRIVAVAKPRPATLFGKGVVEELAASVERMEVGLVVVDHPLSPVQQRNLEKAFYAKVLDRTGLILEIFGRRAHTKEGVLQVELAHLNYQRGRLVRSWTHLERQRGGAGFLGGPGETQIEADRRMLRVKIQKLKHELESVRRTRKLHRAKRSKVPYPVVAIVGYTNAGKSTLFNRLTGAGVVAEDMLFATLDPTLRRVTLPHGTEIILSDTVGFISDLPTHLVAAFRATLEEVVEADLILHLRDVSDPDTSAQAQDVDRILHELGIETADTERVIEVWNKSDLLTNTESDLLSSNSSSHARLGEGALIISAMSGAGIDQLLQRMETLIAGRLETVRVHLGADELRLLDWFYSNGDVLDRTDLDDGGVEMLIRVTAAGRKEIPAKTLIEL